MARSLPVFAQLAVVASLVVGACGPRSAWGHGFAGHVAERLVLTDTRAGVQDEDGLWLWQREHLPARDGAFGPVGPGLLLGAVAVYAVGPEVLVCDAHGGTVLARVPMPGTVRGLEAIGEADLVVDLLRGGTVETRAMHFPVHLGGDLGGDVADWPPPELTRHTGREAWSVGRSLLRDLADDRWFPPPGHAPTSPPPLLTGQERDRARRCAAALTSLEGGDPTNPFLPAYRHLCETAAQRTDALVSALPAVRQRGPAYLRWGALLATQEAGGGPALAEAVRLRGACVVLDYAASAAGVRENPAAVARAVGPPDQSCESPARGTPAAELVALSFGRAEGAFVGWASFASGHNAPDETSVWSGSSAAAVVAWLLGVCLFGAAIGFRRRRRGIGSVRKA